MALQRHDRMARHEDVLTWFPRYGRVLKRDLGVAACKRCKLSLACPEAVHVPGLALFGVEVRYVRVEHEQRPCQAIKPEESCTYPNIRMRFGERLKMLPCEADKARERDEVLDHEDLVAESSNRSEGCEGDPCEETPRGQSPVYHAIRPYLDGNGVPVWPPRCQPVAEMDRCEEEQGASAPAMEPIEFLIAHTRQEPNQVVLPR